MKRLVLVLAALALAGAMLVPSGATPLFQDSTDEITEDVELYPSNSPDGKYAYLDTNNELTLDISAANPNIETTEGVNPDGVTSFEDVFRIHYNGSDHADVWLGHDSDVVTFYARGDTIESPDSNVTLGPNQSVAVGLDVDTTETTSGTLTEDFTVHATVGTPLSSSSVGSTGGFTPSSVTVDSLNIDVQSPTADRRNVSLENLAVGDRIDIDLDSMPIVGQDVRLESVTFQSNTSGDASFVFENETSPPDGTQPPPAGIEPRGYFTLDHSVTDSAVENVSLQFSAQTAYLNRTEVSVDEVTLLRFDGDGWQRLDPTVTDRRNGRVYFRSDSPGLSAYAVGVRIPQFVTTETTLSTTTVEAGETANVTLLVENRGTAAGNETLTLTSNGETVGQQQVSLAPGENRSVRFEVTPESEGNHSLALNNATLDTVVRAASVTPTPSPTQTTQSPTATPSPTQTATVESPTPTQTATAEQTTTTSTSTIAQTDEAGGFGLGPLLGVVATLVVVLMLLAAYRRRRE